MPAFVVDLGWRYDGLFQATFPDIPEVVVYGHDEDDALDQARKALSAELMRRKKSGEPIPQALAEGTLRVEPLAARRRPVLVDSLQPASL